MKIFRLFLLLLLTVSAYAQAPIRRQFFTTNDNPIVDVVAGSNATVQASTPAANIRRFTVNSIPGAGQTNVSVVIQGTNTVVLTNSAGGVIAYTVSSTATGSGSGQTNDTIVAGLTNIVVVTNSSGGKTLYSIGGLTDTNIVTAIAQAQTNGLATTNFVWSSQVWTNDAGVLRPTTNAPITVGKIVTSQEGFTAIGTNTIYSAWTSLADYERYLFEPEDKRLTVRADTAGTGDDDLSVRIMPVGNGYFYLDNAATTAGNIRGGGSVDLQLSRDAGTKIASGVNAVALGKNNTVSGSEGATATGLGNTVSGWIGFAANYGNTVSGYGATAFGFQSSAYLAYQFAHGSGNMSQLADGSPYWLGDAQYSRVNVMCASTNNTPAILKIANSALLVIPANTTWRFRIDVSARTTATTTGDEESAAYEIVGVIERDNSAAATRLVGDPLVTTIAEDDSAWDVWATADTTNGALQINVQGNNEANVRWVATVHLTEIGG